MIFLGPHSHPPAPIDVKFCTAKRTQVPVGPAKFDRNRCNESPLRGEKPDFWPVSKNNTGSLPLRGILPVITRQHVVDVCHHHHTSVVKVKSSRPNLSKRPLSAKIPNQNFEPIPYSDTLCQKVCILAEFCSSATDSALFSVTYFFTSNII